jgi:hypothetical protein
MRNPPEVVEEQLKQLGIISFAMAGLAVVTMVFAWPRGDQLQRS